MRCSTARCIPRKKFKDEVIKIPMMTTKICAVLLIIISLNSMNARKFSEREKSNLKEAIEFMTSSDRELNRLSTAAARATWKWKVNVTDYNRILKEITSKTYYAYSRKIYVAALNFPWKDYKGKNSTLYRWFQLAAKEYGNIDESVLYDGNEDEASPYSKMAEIFGNAKICSPIGDCNITTDDISKVFAASKDSKELKHYWLEYRKKTGEKYRDLFLKAIKKDNIFASYFGYRTKAKYNIALYEDKDFVKNMAEQLKKILPFYKQIHAFVRKKLKKYYKSESIKIDGPIPAHLLGNIHARKWNVFPIVKPYPNSSGVPNVTKSMQKKKMKQIDMFIMAEKFFTSIGMKKMTAPFWHYSLIKKPVDRDVDCHASAHSFNEGQNYRIKMCAKVDTEDLEVIHHEMGHIEYYMHYNHLPFLFRGSANPGFHEAIGDAISLSVLSPDYMRQAGLLKKDKNSKSKESTINYLLEMALMYAVTAPYNYIIDHWRNKVYEGIIKDSELNKKYWQYRLQYQGVCPPSKRTEDHFDIGAKFHIAGGVEYFRYYVANILQFQIHKILCKEAGHRGPLHKCNIYKNKKAGKAFAKFLSQGRSKDWKQSLRSFSDKLYSKVDASAMLEYFKPLMDWLKKKNAKEYIGWKSDDPMSCPGEEESTGSTDTTDSYATSSGMEETETTIFGTTANTESTTSD